MPTSKTYLPDVNILVALASKRHVHNAAASQWLDTVDKGQIAFCRVTQMGLLRLLTNSHVMGIDVTPEKLAWDTYDKMLADKRFCFLQEPLGLEDAWRKLAQSGEPGHRGWTDAYLLAFAQARNCQLVTFDQSLKSKDDAHVLVLSPAL